MSHRVMVGVAALLVLLAFSPAARAEEPARPWSNVLDLGLVRTDGNTQTSSFSFGDKYAYKWTKSDFTFQAAAIRATSSDRVLTNEGGVAVETREDRTLNEMFSLDGKYRHIISDRFFWYGLAGWLRNRPSGINNRYSGGGGIGYQLIKTERDKLNTEFGLDYTKDEPLTGEAKSFMGARGFLGYEHKVSETSKFTSDLELLENLDDTEDLRAKWVTAITGSLTPKIALKASYTILYDRQPAQEIVAGPIPAIFTYQTTDTIFATSLVWTF